MESHRRTLEMFLEAGVKVRFVVCDVIAPEVYMNGKIHDALIYLNKND